jgi:hypothetical protein
VRFRKIILPVAIGLMLAVLAIVGGVVAGRLLAPQPVPLPATPRIEPYIQAVSTARAARLKAQAGTAQDRSDAAKRIEALGLKPDDFGYAACEYVRGRLLVLASRNAEAEECFLRLLDSRSTAPEAMLGIIELDGKTEPARRMRIEECMSQLLPVSVWGRQSDAHRLKSFADVNPPPPSVPSLARNTLWNIAMQYEAASLHDRAWVACAEAIYAGRAPSWIGGHLRHEAWFSPDTAPLWQQAAEIAWRAGERQVACDYLAKSAIFGDDAQFDKAKQAAVRWWAEDPDAKEPEVPVEQRRRAVEEIARLYAEMNAHPRALELIRSRRDWLDKPGELYQKYSAEWKVVVQASGRGSHNIVVYGVEVVPGVDPSTIRIPFACSPEGLQSAKSGVLAILGKAGAKE